MVALVVATSVACDAQSTGAPSNTPSVGVNDNYFSPTSVTIAVGDTVRWVWGGQVAHNVTFDAVNGAPANCGNLGAGVCTRVFTVAGTFLYTCTLHAGMDGSVTVH